MSFGTRLTGHWRRLTEKGLKDIGFKENSKIRGMLLEMGYATEREIKMRIKHREYKINHPFTVMMKTVAKTKDQPLVDTGQLNKSIRTSSVGSSMMPAVFCGVRKTARNANGQSLYQIAKIVHYGKIIKVTPKMRAWLKGHGLPLKPTTNIIRIPPRKFISEVLTDPVHIAYLRKMTKSKMTHILMER